MKVKPRKETTFIKRSLYPSPLIYFLKLETGFDIYDNVYHIVDFVDI